MGDSAPKLNFNELASIFIPGAAPLALADSATGNNVGRTVDIIRDPSSLMPKVGELPPPPNPEDPEVAKKRDAAAEYESRRGGRASTILTGGTGLLDQPSLSRRVLLGS